MKRFLDALKFSVLLVCIVLLVAFGFFDIIDWIVPGDFPDWVYVADLAVNALFVLLALVMFVKKCYKKCKDKK